MFHLLDQAFWRTDRDLNSNLWMFFPKPLYDFLQFDSAEIFPELEKFLSQKSVICQKRDKRGGTKDFDIIPNIKSFELTGSTAQFILAAGNNGSLNPSLIMSAFFEQTKTPPAYFTVTRYMLYDGAMNEFN